MQLHALLISHSATKGSSCPPKCPLRQQTDIQPMSVKNFSALAGEKVFGEVVKTQVELP